MAFIVSSSLRNQLADEFRKPAAQSGSHRRERFKKTPMTVFREQSVREIADPVKQFCAAGGAGVVLLFRQQFPGISNVSPRAEPQTRENATHL
jgi:hypothetical protein